MTDETRTASREHLRELTAALVQGVPTGLPMDITLTHIRNKGKVHRWLRLGLGYDLTKVDFPLVGALLEGRLALRFSNDDRQKLEADGWEIVEVPGGMTLYDMSEEIKLPFGYDREFKVTPTRYQEVAWCPDEPLWPSSRSKTYLRVLKECDEWDREIQDRYGNGVHVLFSTVELAAYLLLQRPEPKLFVYTWTETADINLNRSLCLISSSTGILVDRVRCYYYEGDLGVLRLIGPSF